MPPDPSRLSLLQVAVSVFVVLVATLVAVLLTLRRGISPRLGRHLLSACALIAVASWVRFGQLHLVPIAEAPGGPRVERHVPFQFHEFFHYYLGPKYFPELGYRSLYDCTALADVEIAWVDHASPRLTGYVRNLEDVLAAKTLSHARADCSHTARLRFSQARWDAFKNDLHALQALVPDTWWDEVVDDKGLNPPPTGILLYSGVANVIPIRAEGLPTYLLTTLLDALLIAVSFLGLRKTFGANAAALAAVTFGGSFIASFGWLGGAVLRFAWVAAIALSLWAMRRRRWGLAGILMGCAICDRIFPAAFALGAALPLALQSRHSPRSRRELRRFALGVLVTVSLAIGLSVVLFGFDSFHVFAARLARDRGVHNVLHIGLDKILTYRSWTASQSFGGLDGLLRFRHWNEHIDATWRAIRIPAVLLELLVMGLAMRACLRLHPFEASVLFGVTAMFTLTSPSSYYYGILALVPAVVFRRAWTAPPEARLRELAPLLAFSGFVIVTLLLPQVVQDRIVVDLWICIALAAALGVWIRCAGRPWMTRVRRSL